MPDLYLNFDIDDVTIRDNFVHLENSITKKVFEDFDGILIEVSGDTVADQKVAHGLNYVPTDIIVLRQDNSSFTWHWESFDKTALVYSCTGQHTCRFLVGRYYAS